MYYGQRVSWNNLISSDDWLLGVTVHEPHWGHPALIRQSQVLFKTNGSDFVSLLATKKIEICLRFSLLVAPVEIIAL